MTASTGRPLLVVGLTQRTGTNWLDALLACHADLRRPRRVREDHLGHGAAELVGGVSSITHHWQPDWIDRDDADRALARRVGDAVLSWLAEDAGTTAGARLLTKSPGVGDVGAFLALVGDADVVLLVRDGRDVIASGMAGLGWSAAEGLDRFTVGARGVLTAVGRPLPPGVRVRVVRYEDLVGDLDATLAGLLAWADLDPDRFDHAAAHDLPVLGSSYARGGADRVHWEPVARPSGFNPRGRAADWPRRLVARFVVRCGVEQAALGYPVPPVTRAERATALAEEAARAGVRRTRRLVRGG